MGSKKYVYIDISVGSKPVGRIVIELFVDQAVNATDNFKELCTSKAYKETYFHRVIRGFMVQGGNIDVRRSDVIGDYPFEGEKTLSKGGYSIFRSKSNPTGDFSDENLTAIDKSFLVCMANLGRPDTNRSQLFITTDTAKHLNGKHTVLGRVAHGKSVVRSIENTEVYSANTKDENAWIPKNPVVIEDCGEWKEGDDVPVYDCCRATIGGDIYEEYPDDNELPNVNLDNSEQAYDICLKIKKSAGLLYRDKRYIDSFHKYKKAMRYCNELIADEEKEHDMYVKFLDYKKTLYLNLALTSLELQNYQACIDYCGYLFEFVGDNKEVKLTSVQVSKAFFRLGKAYEGLCKYTEALDALRKGLAVNPEDIGIKTETAKVKKLKYDSEREERTRYTKFFN
ncbi:DEKNAAC102536 [Brettanomyces naardenensis]|uniref:peptidylprolyl isomerase n=1 Tax=Brettanomyces naardenensis TaxID=13370 RepID=A0A448YK85_BRENA|nr:DEKNAAC102536 [Brettanomyces naardenensis]